MRFLKKIIFIFVLLISFFSGSAIYAQDVTSLAFGDSNGTSLVGSLLKPGEKFNFPVMLVKDGETRQLNTEDMKTYQLRVDFPRGKQTLKEAKISTRGGLVFFDIAVEDGWPVDQTDLTFKLHLVSKDGGTILATVEEEFSTGFLVADDDTIAILERGESIEVNSNQPIYTEKQLEKLEKLNDYKKITFRSEEWQVTGNATGVGNINMFYSMQPMPELLRVFPKYDFKTISFPAAPQFLGYASLVLDVSDIEVAFDKNFYVYSYQNGILTKIDFIYNESYGTISVDIPQLGSLVICDNDIQSGYKVV